MSAEEERYFRSVEAAAAQWYVRMQSGQVDEAAEAEFREWLERDPYHRVSYMRCQMTVALAGELRDDPDLRPFYEESARIAAAGTGSSRFGPGGAWLRRARPLLAASFAALMLLAVAVFLLVDRASPQLYQTGVGQQQTVKLADGSEIVLNTDTSLTVEIDDDVRRIRLERGEAFFAVAPDRERPFEVWANGGLVRAVGTAFGVDLRDSRVTVSVLEGRVVVLPEVDGNSSATPASAPYLDANQSVSYSAGGLVSEIREADVRRIQAWREGKLDFDGVPLREAVAEYNRYTPRKIVIGSPEILDQPVSGVVEIGDTESLRFLLQESLGLSVSDRNGQIVLLAPPAAAPRP